MHVDLYLFLWSKDDRIEEFYLSLLSTICGGKKKNAQNVFSDSTISYFETKKEAFIFTASFFVHERERLAGHVARRSFSCSSFVCFSLSCTPFQRFHKSDLLPLVGTPFSLNLFLNIYTVTSFLVSSSPSPSIILSIQDEDAELARVSFAIAFFFASFSFRESLELARSCTCVSVFQF